MPVVSTLTQLGQYWEIVNNSTLATTVNSSGANLIVSLPANSYAYVTCILLTGTTAASWNAQAGVTLTAAQTLTNKTISAGVLTGTLTANGSVGTSGQVLSSTVTGVQWATAAADPIPQVLMLGGM